MEAAKHIISDALSMFIQFGLFIVAVFGGLRIQGHELALIFGLAAAALIISYNDYREKKREQSENGTGRGKDGGSEGENRQNPNAAGKAAG